MPHSLRPYIGEAKHVLANKKIHLSSSDDSQKNAIDFHALAEVEKKITIYEHFVFPGSRHVAVSSLTRDVPVLSCGGLTKRFLVPGWRMGWIIVHDDQQRLGSALQGLRNMCGRILGSNTIIQGALPDILSKTPKSYFDEVINVLYSNAQSTYKMLKTVRGLRPVMPNGAMYMMIGICFEHFPSIKDDKHFVQELVNEQSVFCLPGSCFEYPGYIRIVLTVPAAMIGEACDRITEFCETHCTKSVGDYNNKFNY